MWGNGPRQQHPGYRDTVARTPKQDTVTTIETPVDRSMAVAVMVDVLKHDPAWEDVRSDEVRRKTASRLLAVRWAVRHERVSDDPDRVKIARLNAAGAAVSG